MSLDLEQTIIVELEAKLEQKTKEFASLGKKIDEYKKINIDENSQQLKKLLENFETKKIEIIKLNRKLKELQEKREQNNKEDFEK